jgi:hypothetical protein
MRMRSTINHPVPFPLKPETRNLNTETFLRTFP